MAAPKKTATKETGQGNGAEHPLDTLGRRRWEVVKHDGKDGKAAEDVDARESA